MVKAGYKQTEIGTIPNDWDVIAFGDNLNIIAGIGFKKSEYSSYGIKLLRIDNVSYGNVTWESIAYLPTNYIDKYPNLVIHENDVLLALNRPITNGKLKIAITRKADVPSILYQRVGKIFFLNQAYDRKYAFYLLSKFIKQFVEESAVGTDQPFISTTKLKKHKIPFPHKKEEQRAIAEALSDVDGLIAGLDKLIAKKRAIKTGTMQVLLTGEKRLPGFGGNGRWVTKNQSEVCRYINGRAYSRTEWETSGVPVVRLQNLTGTGDKYYYSNLPLPDHQYMNYGDLIFMWSASFGPYIWKGERAIYHYHIWKIECDKSQVDKSFYYYKLVELTENIKQGSSGSTMAHVTKGGMEKYEITIPADVEEQKAIASILSDMDNEITSLEARRTKTQAIKQGMMQELLTGRTRLPL